MAANFFQFSVSLTLFLLFFGPVAWGADSAKDTPIRSCLTRLELEAVPQGKRWMIRSALDYYNAHAPAAYPRGPVALDLVGNTAVRMVLAPPIWSVKTVQDLLPKREVRLEEQARISAANVLYQWAREPDVQLINIPFGKFATVAREAVSLGFSPGDYHKLISLMGRPAEHVLRFPNSVASNDRLLKAIEAGDFDYLNAEDKIAVIAARTRFQSEIRSYFAPGDLRVLEVCLLFHSIRRIVSFDGVYLESLGFRLHLSIARCIVDHIIVAGGNGGARFFPEGVGEHQAVEALKRLGVIESVVGPDVPSFLGVLQGRAVNDVFSDFLGKQESKEVIAEVKPTLSHEVWRTESALLQMRVTAEYRLEQTRDRSEPDPDFEFYLIGKVYGDGRKLAGNFSVIDGKLYRGGQPELIEGRPVKVIGLHPRRG